MNNDASAMNPILPPSTPSAGLADPQKQQVIAHWEQIGSTADTVTKTIPEIVAILKKRLTTIVSTTITVVAFAIIYCLFTPDIYTARTTLEIRGYAPLLSTSSTETLLGTDTRKIEYQKTTVAKLKLEGLADEALSRDSIAEDLQYYWESTLSPIGKAFASATNLFEQSQHSSLFAENDNHFIHKTSVIHKYLGLIDIFPMHETNLVAISVSASQPELSQKIANGHALAFISHLQTERQEAMSANLKLLQHQATELKNRVSQADQALAAYATQHKILAGNEQNGASLNMKQIEALGELLAQATGRRIKSETLRNEAKSTKIGDFAISDDEVTRQLQITLKQAEAEYALLGSKVTAAFPGMVELRAKIDNLRRSILDQRKQSLKAIDSTYASDKEAEERLREQIEKERTSAQEVSQKLIQYNVLLKEANSLRDLYQAVLKQVKEIEISSSTTTSNVFVSDFASLPTSPSAPKRGLIMALFTLLGLGIGTVLALLVDAHDTTIRSAEEAQRNLDLPLLGAVPQFKQQLGGMDYKAPMLPPVVSQTSGKSLDGHLSPLERTSKVEIAAITPLSTNSIVLEALKTIRAGILLSSADRPPRVIMVSSSVTGEGKSTILCNLAATLAQAHHRTLMIDADLRVSGLSRMFPSTQPNESVGLTDLLTGQTRLSQVISTTAIENLHLLRAGNKSPNPAELLGSLTMKGVMQQLLERYDFILIDSPPILPVADGLVISRLVDSVLMVVRSRVTDRKLAQEARRRLLRVHARILGVVLNDVEPRDDLFDVSSYGDYLPIEKPQVG